LNKRLTILTATLVPTLAVIGLLAWGVSQSGGRPGGLAINTELGEVKIQQEAARPFDLELFAGGTLTLDQLDGKIVMVDFWASWCPPCRQEAPALAQVYREYQAKGVEFVGIDIWDRAEDAIKYVDRYGITYPNGLDDKGTIAIDYGVRGIPEKFFIDRNGVLVQKFVGPMDEAELKQVLDEMLIGDSRPGS
jgi:cytochrome c biogenesis protein CcmG/thiol:disulfide interchange protein DsbE